MTNNLAKTFIKSCLKLTSNSHQSRSLNTFKAAFVKELNKPLVIDDSNQTKLAKNDVRIKVHYCSVNSLDCLSFLDASKHLPYIPGYELSGEVLQVGKNVTDDLLRVGEPVAALSLDKFGGLAEECIVNINDCFRIPTNVNLKDAAVLICGHSTAVYTFSKLHPIKEGNNVLVSAGPAGLGLAAIDVAANMFKAKVIAVTDSEDRSELVRQRGAFSTVTFSPKLKKDVLGLTEQKGADIIYDAVGDYMLDTIGNCVGKNGAIFHAAPVLYKTIPAPPPNSSLTIVSLHALRQQDLELYKCMINDTLELAHEGIISAHVSAKFKFEEVNQAIEYIDAKKCTGKVVIAMNI